MVVAKLSSPEADACAYILRRVVMHRATPSFRWALTLRRGEHHWRVEAVGCGAPRCARMTREGVPAKLLEWLKKSDVLRSSCRISPLPQAPLSIAKSMYALFATLFSHGERCAGGRLSRCR